MTSSTLNGTLYAAHLLGGVAYYGLHLTIKALLSKFCPKLYRELKQDPSKRLEPLVALAIRIILGLSITFPACTIAALSTPWGSKHNLNVSGQVCVVSQGLVWAAEIPTMLRYSVEMSAHHVICLVLLANVAFAPSAHHLVPFYLFLASQFGDLFAGTIVILKAIGHKMDTSSILRAVALMSASWLTFSKASVALYGCGMAFQSPFQVLDWVWAFSMLFLSTYCLFLSYRHLKWTGAVKVHPEQPVGILVCNSARISLYHHFIGISLVIGIAFKTILYSASMDHKILLGELKSAWVESLLTAGLIMYAQYLATRERRGSTSRNISRFPRVFMVPYLSHLDRYSSTALFLCLCKLASFHMPPRIGSLDVAKALGATAINIPLCEAILHFGRWLVLKTETNKHREENKRCQLSTSEDKAYATSHHLRLAWLETSILVCSLSVQRPGFNINELAKVVLSARTALEVTIGGWTRLEQIRQTEVKPNVMAVYHLLQTALALTKISVVFGLLCHTTSTQHLSLKVSVLALLVHILPGLWHYTRNKHSKHEAILKVTWTVYNRITEPLTFSFLALLLLQIITAWEVAKASMHSWQGEESVRLKNSMEVMKSPMMLVGTTILSLLVISVVSTIKAIRVR